MDLLRSRKFRVFVMVTALFLYIGQQGEPYKTDWVMPCIAVTAIGYFMSVAVEDGLKGDKYPQ